MRKNFFTFPIEQRSRVSQFRMDAFSLGYSSHKEENNNIIYLSFEAEEDDDEIYNLYYRNHYDK